MTEKEKIKIIAARLLQGKATESEKKILHEWYDRRGMHKVDEVIVPGSSPKGEIYQRITSRITTQPRVSPPKSSRSHVKWIWAAAAIILLIGSYAIYDWISDRNSPEWITVNTPMGKIEKVLLPDGSVVWINAGSIFRYPGYFKGQERKVELIDGQAFFDVQKDKTRPFIVSAKELQVSVVGTSFEVKSFVGENRAVVGVQTGLVNVHYQNDREIIPLHPGDVASLDKLSGRFEKSEIDVLSIGAWKENRLIFDGDPLGEVVNALERKYDVNIATDNPDLLSLPVTIKADNQPLTDILEVLGYSLGFKYKMVQDNKKVIIFKE